MNQKNRVLFIGTAITLLGALQAQAEQSQPRFPAPDAVYEGTGEVQITSPGTTGLVLPLVALFAGSLSGSFFSHRELKDGVFTGYYQAKIGSRSFNHDVAYSFSFEPNGRDFLVHDLTDPSRKITGSGTCAADACEYSFTIDQGKIKIAERSSYHPDTGALEILSGIQTGYFDSAHIGELTTSYQIVMQPQAQAQIQPQP